MADRVKTDEPQYSSCTDQGQIDHRLNMLTFQFGLDTGSIRREVFHAFDV